MRVLITGSRGYVGNRLCQILNKRYKNFIQIIGLDSNLYEFKKKIEKKLLLKDIRDTNIKDLDKIDIVVHLASLSNDPLGSFNEKLTKEINHKATTKIAKLSKKAGVKRFVFISTQSVYGISKYKNKTIRENDNNISPITQYAKSKLKAEKEILKLADKNFCVIILRPSTVHGPSDNFRSDIVLNNLSASAFTKKKIIINTNGKPYRPVLFIDDLCKIIISCFTKSTKIINKKIYNVGYPGCNFSILQIGKMVNKVFKKSPLIILNNPSHDERSYKVNFELLSKDFNDVINFKKKDIIDDIKKLKFFFKKTNFVHKDFISEKTNRILKLKKLLKLKKINKDLKFI
ncbi:NAD(P)-dependent oxidoreductase [Candidatus Pelagibacter ubique]|jgi:nucleoside-diphosphate-sugar epimerase|nr:NAD(P)-dependent oxidoreductase [Candidatus Pelagibacter ubique]